VNKYAPHTALKSVAPGRLTFDERVVLHRVGMILLTEDAVMPGLILSVGWPYQILPVNEKTRRVARCIDAPHRTRLGSNKEEEEAALQEGTDRSLCWV